MPEVSSLAVLRDANVRRFVASRFCSATASTLLRAAVAWEIYDLTGSAFSLGLLGLVQFAPVVPLSLVAGAVADVYDRRRIALLAQGGGLLCAAALAATSELGAGRLVAIYGAVFALAVASSFESPARSALLPTLVPRERFAGAVALHSTFQNLAWVTGPVAAGFALEAAGARAAYACGGILLATSIAVLAAVRSRTGSGDRRAVSVAAIREGIAFVRERPVLLGAMSLDLFAVIFAGATALLPVYAEEILRVGPRGYGVLSAALEAGTLAMALLLVVLPPIRRPGRALLAAVAVFGLATIVFGLSRSFALSVASFALAGMADQVSMVTRSTIIQLATPDALRGRVSSVNALFVVASNQLGAVESGFLAAVTSATFSVVAGGFACLGVLGVVAARVPELRRYEVG